MIEGCFTIPKEPYLKAEIDTLKKRYEENLKKITEAHNRATKLSEKYSEMGITSLPSNTIKLNLAIAASLLKENTQISQKVYYLETELKETIEIREMRERIPNCERDREKIFFDVLSQYPNGIDRTDLLLKLEEKGIEKQTASRMIVRMLNDGLLFMTQENMIARV